MQNKDLNMLEVNDPSLAKASLEVRAFFEQLLSRSVGGFSVHIEDLFSLPQAPFLDVNKVTIEEGEIVVLQNKFSHFIGFFPEQPTLYLRCLVVNVLSLRHKKILILYRSVRSVYSE